jgi:hypothetical protein
LLPEDPEIPTDLFYGPRATLKLRCHNLDVVNSSLEISYGPGQVLTEIIQTKEWALVASLNGGEIPIKHRVIRDMTKPVQPSVWNSRIFEAGLRTQSYDKGFDRFVGKFNADTPIEAVLSLVKGIHHDHGAAVYFTQEKRRCLLLDTLHGLSDEEALWYTLSMWDKFQPRLANPRKDPGQSYYTDEFSHVSEKYWDTLDNPLSHPDCSESDFTKAAMTECTSALSQTDLSGFEPLVDAEAKQSSLDIAQEAAISRLCIVKDAVDFWYGGRTGPHTDLGGSTPV